MNGPKTDAENELNRELAAFHHDSDMTPTSRCSVVYIGKES